MFQLSEKDIVCIGIASFAFLLYLQAQRRTWAIEDIASALGRMAPTYAEVASRAKGPCGCKGATHAHATPVPTSTEVAP